MGNAVLSTKLGPSLGRGTDRRKENHQHSERDLKTRSQRYTQV